MYYYKYYYILPTNTNISLSGVFIGVKYSIFFDYFRLFGSFNNFHVQLKRIEIEFAYRFAGYGFRDFERSCQNLMRNIVAICYYRRIGFGMRGDCNLNLVGNIESARLPDVLDAVHQLPCHAFTLQFFGNRNIQCNGKRAFVRNQPAGNIF
mgnify:CR=1 FL=1